MAGRPSTGVLPAGSGQPPVSKWARWYQPGSENDAEIYAQALQKCKEINKDLSAGPLLDEKQSFVASKIRESSEIWVPRHYDAQWLTAHINREYKRIQKSQASRKEWVQSVKKVADGFVNFANLIKPIVDIFIPQSPEYTVPYACIWIVFKGFSTRKDKKDSVLDLVLALYEDIPVFEAYGDMFPTASMKTALAQFYLQTADFLWKLAQYYAKHFFTQLADALFPRAQFNFATSQAHIKKTAARLKQLCDTGHVAEQKDIKDRVDGIASELHDLSEEVYRMSAQFENSQVAHSQRLTSELIDIWHEDVGDVEREVQMWDSLRLWTDQRDHWSENGVLHHLTRWQTECEKSSNTILWICTEKNGRQAWLTELSVDLLRVCRTQNQTTTFALCDRPGDVKWTPRQVLQQLISQLLIQNPKLTAMNPSVFCPRTFRRSSSFKSTFRLLHTLAGMVESLVIVIDRLDLCIPSPDEEHPSIVQALSILVRTYAKSVRIIITTARVVRPHNLPNLPISFSEVKTRRRPRRRFDDWPSSRREGRPPIRIIRHIPRRMPSPEFSPSESSLPDSPARIGSNELGSIQMTLSEEWAERRETVEMRMVPHGSC